MTHSNDMALLKRITVLANDFRTTRSRLYEEALARAQANLAEKERGLELAVMDALGSGHSVASVARAYTPPGKTPNRGKIYEIRKRMDKTVTERGGFPFRWEPRVIETVDGADTLYDAVGILEDFGPENVTGVFRWTYYEGQLEPVIDPVAEPYPYTKYYMSSLNQWLELNPYPTEETEEENDS